VGKDGLVGERTCKDTSLVDYFLASSKLFSNISEFEVLKFSPMFSDVHRQLHITLKCTGKVVGKRDQTERSPKPERAANWDPNKREEFIDCFIQDNRLTDICEMTNLLNIQHKNGQQVTVENINSVVDQIGKLYDDTAKSILGLRHNRNYHTGRGSTRNTYREQKPWFDDNCKKKRANFHKARKVYNLFKNDINRDQLNKTSREFKRALNNGFMNYQNKIAKDIRDASKNDPKKFWQIINRCSEKRKTDSDISLEELYNYFKEMNSYEENDAEHVPNANDINLDVRNEILDAPITASEIESVITKLQNNKAAGVDNITNEYIKFTLHIMLPIYTKQFNLVFDSGVIPESWSIGVINPIFKNKGNRKDPANYRSITLVSCFGKVFTSILNNRLTLFSDEINLISSSQAGFRKGHSTSDNIFILHSLINLYLSKKKKLFCTFIDFKAAFDKVWRTGLWTKMIKNNVNGKCFVVIKNMYENIKSCVTNNGNYSVFFPCRIGVRQGENLYSFLFALFINDIEEFFENRNISPLHIIDEMNDNLLGVFIKLFILLYADDTVIFSETREEMQNMLDVFTDYCKQWKLYVNIDKTKVVVFSKRRYEANHKFKVNGEEIQFSDNYTVTWECYLTTMVILLMLKKD